MALPKAVLDLTVAAAVPVLVAPPGGTGRVLQARLFSRPIRLRAGKNMTSKVEQYSVILAITL